MDGDKVNLYGYTSMAVATLQVQAEQLRALQAEIAQLHKQLDRLQKPRAQRRATAGH